MTLAKRTVTMMLLIAMPVVLPGQVLRGRIVTADSSRGVAGAVLLLLDGSGREVARNISDPQGRFTVRAPLAGVFHLRTLRIGFRRGELGPFALDSGAVVERTIPLVEVATSLAAVRIVEQTACRGREEGGDATLMVWEEVRNALMATVVARTALHPVMSVASFERVTSARSGRTTRQHITHRTGESTRPFGSARTPEVYAADGYEERDSTGITYGAPDADVLLSDSFAAAHCFSLTSHPTEPTSIGLAFRPVAHDDPHRVDVAGTLWLDRASARLRRLEFRYTGLPQAQEDAGAGGAMDFAQLVNGLWVISRWEIRIPRVAIVRGSRTTASGGLGGLGSLSSHSTQSSSLTEVWTFGGAVTSIRLDGAPILHLAESRLAGQVSDERTHSPLGGSAIVLSETDYSTTTDSAGRFQLDGIMPGAYELEVTTPFHRSLSRAEPHRVSVDLRDTGTTLLRVPVPSSLAMMADMCRRSGSSLGDREGALIGIVRDEAGMAQPDVRVSGRWTGVETLQGGTTGLSANAPEVSTMSDSSGRYVLCGVPTKSLIALTARRGSLRAALQSVRLPDTRVAVADLSVGTNVHDAIAGDLESASAIIPVAGAHGAPPRRRPGSGAVFLTLEQIEARHATMTDQLLRLMPGIRLERSSMGVVIVADRGLRSIAEVGGGDKRCNGVQVLIDAVPVTQPFDPNQVPPSAIQSIELYSGAGTTPTELRTPKSICGTLAIFTK